MTPEQLETHIEWIDTQRASAEKIASNDPDLHERLMARGRCDAHRTDANRLRAARSS